VKEELIANGVNPQRINPSLGESAKELKLAGFFKQKDQDICVTPNNFEKAPEVLTSEGLLHGIKDPYGYVYTERTLSINVRSQLSSAAKNFDTLYERTFAEALNLHLRCPKMVLGEFYMIPVYEYNSKAASKKKVEFKQVKSVSKYIEKYLLAFNALNGSDGTPSQSYRYERICLLIVDFSQKTPKIYNTDEELRKDGLLAADSITSIERLSFPNFIRELLDVYASRFGAGRFT
jgi:hypothetical protein